MHRIIRQSGRYQRIPEVLGNRSQLLHRGGRQLTLNERRALRHQYTGGTHLNPDVKLAVAPGKPKAYAVDDFYFSHGTVSGARPIFAPGCQKSINGGDSHNCAFRTCGRNDAESRPLPQS